MLTKLEANKHIRFSRFHWYRPLTNILFKGVVPTGESQIKNTAAKNTCHSVVSNNRWNHVKLLLHSNDILKWKINSDTYEYQATRLPRKLLDVCIYFSLQHKCIASQIKCSIFARSKYNRHLLVCSCPTWLSVPLWMILARIMQVRACLEFS